MLALKLAKIAPGRGACPPEFNKDSILVAPHRRKASINQKVRSPSRLKRAAYMIAEVHDLAMPRPAMSASTASSAGQFPWTSAIAANFI
jgi:hypothetical protein